MSNINKPPAPESGAAPAANAAAMREALETVRKYVKETTPDRVMLGVIEVWCDEALAAPPASAPAANAAAMREALSDACYAMFNFLKKQNGGYEEMANALDKAKSALAAPPRNCDRFATAVEADKAFNGFCAAERTGKCKPAECMLPSGTGATSCQLAWLFAPATKQKGETDGGKNVQKMRDALAEGGAEHKTHAEIIAEARDKYTVHDCNECEYRKSCDLNSHGFDSDECREKRQSIALLFGIDDGYFTKLLCRLEAAWKRDAEKIERIVRDSVVDYNEMYCNAPNDDAEREIAERAETANEWLNAHGMETEPFYYSKEETPCL